MLKLLRLAVLLIAAVIITTLLYWVDTDAPSDTFSQMAMNTFVIFALITLIYSCIYRLRRG